MSNCLINANKPGANPNTQAAPRSLIQLLTEFIFGHKYYANITFTRGKLENGLSYFIFRTRQQANDHAISLRENKSYGFVETISFRSRKLY